MQTAVPLRRFAAALTLTAALGAALMTAGCDAGTLSTTTSASTGTGTAQARQQLDGLTVAAERPMTNYSRDRFPHWIAQGNGCDTREVVLKRDGSDVKTDATCKVTSGSWVSRYDDKKSTDPESLDIDHMVPLANAWRSGADSWTDAKRQDFANDLTRPQLLAVTASSNRSKGDQNPAQWKPPTHAYWCTYAQRWIAVKAYWTLTITAAEKTALIDMLATCT